MERANEISVGWEQILSSVRQDFELSEISFNTWLRPLCLHHIDEKAHQVSIVVPAGEMAVNYIRKKYGYALKAVISEYAGTEYDVSLLTREDAKDEEKRCNINKNRRPFGYKQKGFHPDLNDDLTFNRFVVGNNNKFACAAAMNVARLPGKTAYNPLYLYSSSGLGKTHLMQAIGHKVVSEHPELKVVYVPSDIFANELIMAIRSGHDNMSLMEQFREKYRTADVLLIDDIQFLIGKEASQQEFFHTFNVLFDAHKQIVLSSDRPPRELSALDERYRSRCAMGLQADITSPDFETRMAILNSCNEQTDVRICQDVLQYIAAGITDNIRMLIGAYKKVSAMIRLTGEEMTREKAVECLQDTIFPDERRNVTTELIAETVAEHLGICTEDILGRKRNREIVYARHLSTYLARDLTDLTLAEIGKKIGGRDHTTASYSLKKFDEEMRTSEETRRTVEILKKKLA